MKLLRKIMMVLIVVMVPVLTLGYLMAINVRVAKVQSFKGTVNVQRAETGQWVAAEKGMKLYEGDVVKTGGRSKVVIELDDGSITQLTSLANMKMEKLSRSLKGKKTNLDIEVGKSWMKVNKLRSRNDKFSVGTPSAVAGVRGTYFSTEVEQTTDSTFDVFDGEIAVSQRHDPTNVVSVRSNQRSQVNRGRAPSTPKQIPASDLKDGLSQGIQNDAQGEDASYDLKISVEPATLKAGEQGIAKIQFKENGAAYNGAVMFTLSLGGSAMFVENGSQTMEVSSNEKGYIEVQVIATGAEEVQLNADVSFLVEE